MSATDDAQTVREHLLGSNCGYLPQHEPVLALARLEARALQADHYENALKRARARAIDAYNECGIAAPQDHFLRDIERIADTALAGGTAGNNT